MQDFDKEELGNCLVCTGHSGGECFCASLNSQTPRQITHLHQISISIEQTNKQKQRDQKNSSKEAQKKTKRPKKDNTEHKKINTIIKKIYKNLSKKEIRNQYQHLYHRQDYFLILISLIEKQGIIEAVYIQFKTQMKKYLQKIQNNTHLDEKNKSYIIDMIHSHLISFYELNQGRLIQSIKTLYGYETMKQKKKYNVSQNMVKNIRQELGLSF